MASYLRLRIEKIEKFTHYLIEKEKKITDENLTALSSEEKKYAKE